MMARPPIAQRIVERSAEEVRAAIRAQGIPALQEVEAVVLETDGTFSVTQRSDAPASALEDVLKRHQPSQGLRY